MQDNAIHDRKKMVNTNFSCVECFPTLLGEAIVSKGGPTFNNQSTIKMYAGMIPVSNRMLLDCYPKILSHYGVYNKRDYNQFVEGLSKQMGGDISKMIEYFIYEDLVSCFRVMRLDGILLNKYG
jgi:hypothetical protein